jgi:hypothetical protein
VEACFGLWMFVAVLVDFVCGSSLRVEDRSVRWREDQCIVRLLTLSLIQEFLRNAVYHGSLKLTTQYSSFDEVSLCIGPNHGSSTLTTQ